MSPWCTLATCPLFQAIVTASQACFGDSAAVTGFTPPVNAGALLEGLGFVDCHCRSRLSVAGRNSEARSLFSPCRDFVRAFLDRPFILAVWDDGEAGTLGMLPGRAKTLRTEPPRALFL